MFFDDIGISDCHGGTCTELLHVVTKLINIMVENVTISLRIFAACQQMNHQIHIKLNVFAYKLSLSKENIRTF